MILPSKIPCELCGELLTCTDEFEAHVANDHMMSYSSYYEYVKSIESVECDVCERNLHRTSPWFDLYNPCIDCGNNRIYFDSVMINIDKIYGYLCSNRLLKLFILDRDLRDRLIKFDLLEYCKRLNKVNRLVYDYNLYTIQTKKGRSPYIDYSLSNVEFVPSPYNITRKDMIVCEDYYSFNIGSNRYELHLPEECEYHNNNHYKYNILNRCNNSQSAKKLLLSSGTCIKFYNTNFDGCKSILKIMKNGSQVYAIGLSTEELNHIKFYIMSNSVLLRYLLGILMEIMRNSDVVYDYSFLLNKVTINPSGKFNMIIDWTLNNRMLESDHKETLNISIL